MLHLDKCQQVELYGNKINKNTKKHKKYHGKYDRNNRRSKKFRWM